MNNRIIKFRAWDRERKIWLPAECMHLESENFVIKFASDIKTIELMEFTGLLDKDGKEIYEGDIVKHQNDIGQIVWRSHYFMMECNQKPESREINYRNWEIIGNIYENSELLKS